MTENEKIIVKFYTALSNADTDKMCECYHSNIQFIDPVFGLLKGNEVCQMWKMLLESSNDNLKIGFSDVTADEHLGSARWIVNYRFSITKRKVINHIYSKFHFKEGLIIKQTDDYDVWKWAKQAMGLKGFLLGWTGFLQKKIQEQARLSLKTFSEKIHE